MKTIIIFIFSLLLIGKIQAQTATPNKIDDKNRKQGKWTLYYDKDGEETTTKSKALFYSVGEMRNNNWVGLRTVYNVKNNFKVTEETYLNEQANGMANYYDERGKISSKGWYLKGKKDSLWYVYHSNGKIKETATFINGRRHGLCQVFNEQGQISEKFIYESGEIIADDWTMLSDVGKEATNDKKYTQALSLLTKAKAMAERKFSKNHKNYTISCENLSDLYEKQALYAKATVFYLETKETREKMFGKDYPDYANSCIKLADLYEKQKLYAKAEPLYVEALDIYKVSLGEKSNEYTQTTKKLVVLRENVSKK